MSKFAGSLNPVQRGIYITLIIIITTRVLQLSEDDWMDGRMEENVYPSILPIFVVYEVNYALLPFLPSPAILPFAISAIVLSVLAKHLATFVDR